MQIIDGIARRCRMDHWTPAEKAIFDATQAVEHLVPHPLLTDAVVLLSQAQAKVADFVELDQDPKMKVKQWISEGEGWWFGREAEGCVWVVVTNGPKPGDPNCTIREKRLVCDGHWASLVLNMTAFDERPNDWQAFMDHHHGRADLLKEAKLLQTVRNVVSSE